MKRRSILATACVAILGTVSAALANGAVSEFPAGGLVFQPEEKISIAREDLEIDWDRINVRYVFVSSASEPLERTIGFPLARVSLADGPDNVENRSWSGDEGVDEPRNYMAFRVSVNGKPLTPKLHEYAWSGDTDITARILDLGIPLFAAAPDSHVLLAQLPEATLAELRRDDLVWDEAPPGAGWIAPKWQYQSVYEWTQTFLPGETVVEISYRPLFGADIDYHHYYPDGEGASLYCMDEATEQAIRIRGGQPEAFTVGYILQTARYWNGPIGDFRLKVGGDHGPLFAFCAPEGLKPAGDGKSWAAKNFIPRSDLKIVFYVYG